MGQCLSNFSAVYNQNWSPEPQLDTNLIKDQSKLWWLLLSLGGHWAVPGSGHSVPSPALNRLTLMLGVWLWSGAAEIRVAELISGVIR